MDYSIPVYIDDITGLLFLEMSKDEGILHRAFGWRVWLAILVTALFYIGILGLTDWIYCGSCNWWSYLEFCLRSICLDSAKIPEKQNYNRVLSLSWILMSFFLFLAYEGKSSSHYLFLETLQNLT